MNYITSTGIMCILLTIAIIISAVTDKNKKRYHEYQVRTNSAEGDYDDTYKDITACLSYIAVPLYVTFAILLYYMR